MWDPNQTVCLDLPEFPKIDDICFPGGFCLSHVHQAINAVPHGADVPLQFFSQIGPAMAFLQPLFKIVEFAVQIFKCIEAIPDAITNLDPMGVIECVPGLADILNYILEMIPQVSIPRMIIKLVRAMAALLRAVASDFEYIKSQIQRINDAINRAADLNDVEMSGFLQCAEKTAEDSMMSTATALQGIGRIILLINIFVAIIGGEEIPCFTTIAADKLAGPLDVVIDVLTGIAEVLDEIADNIPDPIYDLTLALAAQKC